MRKKGKKTHQALILEWGKGKFASCDVVIVPLWVVFVVTFDDYMMSCLFFFFSVAVGRSLLVLFCFVFVFFSCCLWLAFVDITTINPV